MMKIAGSAVRILRSGDREHLLIDGRPCRFHKTDAGYVISTNVYAEPQKSLLAAVALSLEDSSD